jgi:hypothetical protein
MSITSDSADRPTLVGRKRSRLDYTVDSYATPATPMEDWSNGMDTIDSMARSENMDPGSPIPFVNTRYQLAGGLDTPSAAAAAAHEAGASEYAEVGYRKTLGDTRKTYEGGHSPYFPTTPTAQFTDGNGRPRIQGYEPRNVGWSKVAIEVVGGVVGKVWEFCKAGAFRGFTAGGGKAYNDQSQPHTPLENDSRLHDTTEKDPMFVDGTDRDFTPIPGQFTDDDFISDYLDRRTLESTPPRPSKRLQLNNEEGELARNWIMVPNTPGAVSKAPTPHSRPTQPARYSMPTASSSGRRLAGTPSTRPVASRANIRRSLLPHTHTRASTVSHAGSPSLHATRPASYASPRSPGGSQIPVPSKSVPLSPQKKNFSNLSNQNIQYAKASPASIEAQKWAAKRKKEEMEQDESIRRLNAQLKDMIRQGKEALGTRVEVEDLRDELVGEEVGDDGFEDGELEVEISGRWVA